ncbi:phage tail protein [Endozoicomonas euniceicola]|uniref:Phage tail protein n=1 Tax=Endozoicomonas euniceicola TaxID=1234143 RepID=A0ABY6GND5_9GAMM|nr:phage tail protein [Endozoicomonas euniceicola]UYM14247.1 phage tail protein [Endozoicomonas euniceicola]
MSQVMMKLGNYTFSLNTAAYQRLQRTTSYRWSSQDRINKTAARQFIGPGDDTIKLAGVIFPQFNGGAGQLDSLRELAGTGKPHLLVDSLGIVHGYWCLTDIDETQTKHLAGGIPRQQEFSLSLIYYGDTLPNQAG